MRTLSVLCTQSRHMAPIQWDSACAFHAQQSDLSFLEKVDVRCCRARPRSTESHVGIRQRCKHSKPENLPQLSATALSYLVNVTH
jgi:hypothetical protein